MIQSNLNLPRAVPGSLKIRNQLELENTLLRQLLLVVWCTTPKPKFTNSDRLLFAWISQTVRIGKRSSYPQAGIRHQVEQARR